VQADFLLRDDERFGLHTYAMLRPYYEAHAKTLPRPWEARAMPAPAA